MPTDPTPVHPWVGIFDAHFHASIFPNSSTRSVSIAPSICRRVFVSVVVRSVSSLGGSDGQLSGAGSIASTGSGAVGATAATGSAVLRSLSHSTSASKLGVYDGGAGYAYTQSVSGTCVQYSSAVQCGAVQSAGSLRLIASDHRPYLVAIVSLIVQIIPVPNRCHSCVRAPDVSMGLSHTACQDSFVPN